MGARDIRDSRKSHRIVWTREGDMRASEGAGRVGNRARSQEMTPEDFIWGPQPQESHGGPIRRTICFHFLALYFLCVNDGGGEARTTATFSQQLRTAPVEKVIYWRRLAGIGPWVGLEALLD